MWLTKKILVPCDFADCSRTACDVALELAQSFRVPLVLLHVFQFPPAVYTGMPALAVPEYDQLVEASARTALHDESARLQGKGVALETSFARGSAWEEIIDAAKRLDAGLIVMGTHGRRGLPRAIMGSVTEKVVRLSPVPVLTIHGTNVQATSSVAAAGT
jgi:nucleotide-binding universal stress UspA family protein